MCRFFGSATFLSIYFTVSIPTIHWIIGLTDPRRGCASGVGGDAFSAIAFSIFSRFNRSLALLFCAALPFGERRCAVLIPVFEIMVYGGTRLGLCLNLDM